MKKIIVIAFLFASSSLIAQDFTFSGDTLLIKGAKFFADTKIKIGYGSGINKEFAYITTSPFSLDGKRGMDKSYANLNMTIKEIRVLKNKKLGDKVFLLLKGPAFINFWCDIEAAIDQGEVKVQ